MGKRIKLRNAQQFAAQEAFRARLRAHAWAHEPRPRAPFIGAFAEFPDCYRARLDAYRRFALNPPEAWQCRIRTRDPQARFLDLVRFVFARFPVVRHLEAAWTDELHAHGEAGQPDDGEALHPTRPDFRYWYILVAQGTSLHETTTHRFLTRRETHYFLAAPAAVTATTRAFWYAIARGAASGEDAALRVARSKIAGYPVAWSFWRDVARYFARNPVSVLEMNDLIDFIAAAEAEDTFFSLAGRGLPARRRRMEEWHATLRARDTVCGGSWPGRAQPDAEYATNCGDALAVWRFRQIKTGDDLYREGQRMHHCVVAYKARCLSAETSIWSMTCEYPAGKHNRGVTIEVACDGTIVQCRGFANRAPFANELAAVRAWASDYDLVF